MTTEPMTDFNQLCVHTITTKPWPVETAARKFAKVGVRGITVWREALDGRNPTDVGQMLREEGLEVVSLCRGGFFPHPDAEKRREAIDDNRKAIEEAAATGHWDSGIVIGEQVPR